MTNDETKEEAFETIPFTEEMSKKEMIAHLRELHGARRLHGLALTATNSKATKDHMVRYHDSAHKVLDDPRCQDNHPQPGYSGFYDDLTRREYHLLTPPMRHIHTAYVLSGNPDEMVANARRNEPVSEKPLSPTERKVLTDLVNNDFRTLEQEMRQLAADNIKVRLEEIKDEWADRVKVAPEFTNRARRLVTKAQRHLDRLKAEAKDQGIDLKIANPLTYAFSPTSEVEGYAAAIKEANEENDKMLKRALLTLERQRLTAQRRVLISGVSREAATILDTVPEARALMVAAYEEEATRRPRPEISLEKELKDETAS